MDNLAGIGAALAAMRPDDGRRYEGCLMLSALPQAPTIPHRRTFAERFRRLTHRWFRAHRGRRD
ncbi:hypothetical protein GCM10022225_08840 [Plantactinospora mayteni]|uniref:Uncharacterized protein n=1 Tax=Plantactinospora mayteni TaxID=566021 RepID=A0ABQ4EIA3_9ACTN|nr:hypothetical protein Pma05_09420 [Plantactinospora mayteni]